MAHATQAAGLTFGDQRETVKDLTRVCDVTDRGVYVERVTVERNGSATFQTRAVRVVSFATLAAFPEIPCIDMTEASERERAFAEEVLGEC